MGRPGFSSDIGLPETASMSQAKFFIAAWWTVVYRLTSMPGFRKWDKKTTALWGFFKILLCYWLLAAILLRICCRKKVNPVLVMLKLSLPVLGVIFPVFL